MKKIILVIAVGAALYSFVYKSGVSMPSQFGASSTRYEKALEQAYDNKHSDLQIQGKGTVIKLLKDDLKGVRHQRFILKLRTDQTLLIAHNIDLAPRISQLKNGDIVEFYGEYEWNSKGGVIHWTHRDPKGRHIAGWLKHQGKTYN